MCSFSYAGRLALIFSIQAITALSYMQTVSCQPAEKNEAASDSVLPQTAQPSHPVVPERTIPAPPAVTAGSTNSSCIPAKAPLAWRQKALALSMDKFKDKQPADGPTTRLFAAGYSETIAALTSSSAALNYKAEHLNSSAGELLLSNSDGKVRLIFCLWEQSPGKTWVAAGVDRGAGAAARKTLSDILDTASNTVTHRGRI